MPVAPFLKQIIVGNAIMFAVCGWMLYSDHTNGAAITTTVAAYELFYIGMGCGAAYFLKKMPSGFSQFLV